MQNDEDALDAVTEIFRDVLGDDTLLLTRATTAQDVDGWDSLNHVRLMLAIQSAMKIKFTAAEINRLKNVGDLLDLIHAKQG